MTACLISLNGVSQLQDTNSFCFSGLEIKRITASILKYDALIIHSNKQDSLIFEILHSYDSTQTIYNNLNYEHKVLKKEYKTFKRNTLIAGGITLLAWLTSLLAK